MKVKGKTAGGKRAVRLKDLSPSNKAGKRVKGGATIVSHDLGPDNVQKKHVSNR